MKSLRLILTLVLLCGGALACNAPSKAAKQESHETQAATNSEHDGHAREAQLEKDEKQAVRATAICELSPTEGNDVTGSVTFEQMDGFVKVSAHIMGLTPGKHGFHIHETGDCSSPDGKSAGGHFNPAGHDHAGPDADMRHAGDMGNLVADESGMALFESEDRVIQMSGPDSIIGRGFIIHAGEDDLTSQPTGAAGARVACGVIAAVS